MGISENLSVVVPELKYSDSIFNNLFDLKFSKIKLSILKLFNAIPSVILIWEICEKC